MNTSTVLIVDDERLIRWSIRMRLEEAGFQVVDAETGREAMERFRSDVQFVLLDLRLPDTNGLTLLKQMKRERPDCEVVIMSAHGTHETAAEAIENGALGVLNKPFSFDELTRMVEEALS